MNEQDFDNIIAVFRSAPIANMAEAEARAELLAKLVTHAREFLEIDSPENPGGSG